MRSMRKALRPSARLAVLRYGLITCTQGCLSFTFLLIHACVSIFCRATRLLASTHVTIRKPAQSVGAAVIVLPQGQMLVLMRVIFAVSIFAMLSFPCTRVSGMRQQVLLTAECDPCALECTLWTGRHYEICKYYQSTSKAHTEALLDLIVCRSTSSSQAGLVALHLISR